MMVISCGYTVGAMLGGGISALLVPWGGWQSIFILAVLSLIIFFITYFKMPESLYF